MNRVDFNQAGGFPFTTNIMDAVQNAYSLFNSVGELAGNHAIIQGGVVTGTSVSAGVVYINGEILPLKAGTLSSSIIVVEDVESRTFENGDYKYTLRKRYAQFGVGSSQIPWSNFKRVNSLLTIAEQILALQGRILPAKTNPQLYCGSLAAIPAGWQLCDGTNGTPDLRNKFIVGYDPADSDYNAIGKTGGEKKHILTQAELPNVSLSGTTDTGGSHSHSITPTVPGIGNGSGGGSLSYYKNTPHIPVTSTASAGAHAHNVSVALGGAGTAHENRPPYFTIAYIIYVGS